MTDKEFIRMPNSYPSGGWQVTDEQAIQEQRGVVWELIKQLGESITKGASLTRIAIPVNIAEPRSYVERIADGWCFAPIYLTKAARLIDEPIERLKNVMAFAISGFHNTTYPKKPFNPILGETYQATYEDGAQLFCEQSSHHPPVTNWEMLGPDNCYHFYGSGEWVASFRGNSIKGQQMGDHHITFPDGGHITYNLAEVWARGIMFGDRVVEYDGEMFFRDKVNNLIGKLKINPEVASWFGWGKKKLPSDYIKGGIYHMDADGNETGENLCEVNGTWLGCLEFDGLPYWSFELQMPKSLPVAVDIPLPSDCRFREDVIFLKAEDIPSAAEWKHNLEEKQRRDARLRKEYAEKHGLPVVH